MQDLQKRRKSESEFANKKAEEQRRGELQRKHEEADLQASQVIAHLKQATMFSLPWSATGHPAITVLDDIAAAAALFKRADPYAEPCIVKIPDFSTAQQQSFKVAGKVMDSWMVQFNVVVIMFNALQNRIFWEFKTKYNETRMVNIIFRVVRSCSGLLC